MLCNFANLNREFVWDLELEISKSFTIHPCPTQPEYDKGIMFPPRLAELTNLLGISQDSSAFCATPVD